MHSDPLADMLTRIRNGSRARLERVAIPWSRLKLKIIEILQREGFVRDFSQVTAASLGQGEIVVYLKYDSDGAAVIGDIQRVSRPGLRRYFSTNEIPRVRNGLGMMILSTSKGVMTDREARKERVGGEALCLVY